MKILATSILATAIVSAAHGIDPTDRSAYASTTNPTTPTTTTTTTTEEAGDDYVVPPASLARAPYAPWAHLPLAWLPSRESNQSSVLSFVRGFLDRNISIGATDIDSQWATGDNTFVFNDAKFPNATQMFATLHSWGVRTILWATSMIDTDSPNFAEAAKKRFFVYNPLGGCELKWWHGRGCLLDYTNPEAVAWWHAQMRVALDSGADGFKCDGTDPYLFELVVPRSGAPGGRIVTYREYADAYYRDFLAESRRIAGEEALIMSRPVDADWTFSPRDVVFLGWTGDSDPTFHGLRGALTDAIRSAWRGFVSFSAGDIGGYRGGGPAPHGRSLPLFTRWYQLGALLPVMENGGEGDHAPWLFDAPGSTAVTDNYRLFAEIHTELVPYLLAAGAEAYDDPRGSIVRPLAFRDDPLPIAPDTFNYLLGADILVAPFLDNGTSVEVKFPHGSDWVDWWDTSKVYRGGDAVAYSCPLDRFPVFKRSGSVIPLNVSRGGITGLGDARHLGHLTLHVSRPARKNPRPLSARPGGVSVRSRSARATRIRSESDNIHSAARDHDHDHDDPDHDDRKGSVQSKYDDPHHGSTVRGAFSGEGAWREFGSGGGRRASYRYDPETRTLSAAVSAHSVPVVLVLDGVRFDPQSVRVTVINNSGSGSAAVRFEPFGSGMRIWSGDASKGLKIKVEGITDLDDDEPTL